MKLAGADFGAQGATKVKAVVRTNGKSGVIRVSADSFDNAAGYIEVQPDGNETTVCTAVLDQKLTGVKDILFTFSGEGYEIVEWSFEA